jgi:hypothetical protein
MSKQGNIMTHTLEEASFNDTIDEIEDVVDLSCLHDQLVISVNSINRYTVIDEYHQGNLMELAGVNTKYKIVTRKIKPVVVALLEDSWQKMKQFANDPRLRNPKTKEKLRVGREDFLLDEERMFRRMLELVKKDVTLLALPIVGKGIKVFKRRDRSEIGFEALDDSILSIDSQVEYPTGEASPKLAHTGGCACLVGVNAVCLFTHNMKHNKITLA